MYSTSYLPWGGMGWSKAFGSNMNVKQNGLTSTGGLQIHALPAEPTGHPTSRRETANQQLF